MSRILLVLVGIDPGVSHLGGEIVSHNTTDARRWWQIHGRWKEMGGVKFEPICEILRMILHLTSHGMLIFLSVVSEPAMVVSLLCRCAIFCLKFTTLNITLVVC